MQFNKIYKNVVYTVLAIIAIISSFGKEVAAQNWEPLGGGIYYPPRAIYADSLDNYLYAAGIFLEVDGIPCRGIARWNGLAWDSLGSGIDALDTLGGSPNNTLSISRFGSELYVGGTFKYVGNTPAYGIGKWNGTSWGPHSNPPFSKQVAVGVVKAIDNELYVGGSFDTVMNQPCRSLAKWNGTSWQCLELPDDSNGNDQSIGAICEYHGEIYAAGNFGFPPYDSIVDIARWDGLHWRSVGGGLKGVMSFVCAMTVFEDELYVAGYFSKNEGNFGTNIQKWNGESWSEVGGGIDNGQVNSLLVFNDKLYTVGAFSIAGGIFASRIAFWDGIQWCGLGSAIDNSIMALCEYQNTLHIGGGFWTIDGDSILKIAKWTGGNYIGQCGNNAGIAEEENISIDIYPNPAEEYVVITIPDLDLNLNAEAYYNIYSMLGEVVATGVIPSDFSPISISSLTQGLYSMEIIINKKKVNKMLIKI